MTLQPGTTIGRYEVVESIGQGGMATVYKARQPALDRVVALKVIRAGYSEDPEFLERFRREARAVARLDHPNVVQVYDFDEIDGRAILAMQFLDSGTLKDRVGELAREGRLLSQDEAVRTIEQIAAGLGYAHSLGVIHRDVKPANVMFTHDARAVVTDFGIARMLGGTQLTATGVGIGTPEYMSPEQGQGGELDARSDVYSLGVVAYELLTGKLPFTGDTPFAVVLKHVRDPLPRPSELNPAVSVAMEQVLQRALEKEPAARFASVTELANALRGSTGEGAEEARTLPTVRVGTRPSGAPAAAAAAPGELGERRRRAIGLLVAFALVAALYLEALPRARSFDPARLGALFETASATSTPRATPRTPTPPPFKAVTYRPDQVIMPPEDFQRALAEAGLPVAGYQVTRDERGSSERVWDREFRSTSAALNRVEIDVTISPTGGTYSPSACDSYSFTPTPPTSVAALARPSVGERQGACRYEFSSGDRWFLVQAASRNVYIESWVHVTSAGTDRAASDLAIRLALVQLAIIDRVAPP